MKKTLIALAVLGASGFAVAQSSVTLYGVADAGVGRIKSNADNAAGKTKLISGSLMNNAGSRVGFTGVEDLGNGSKVGFQFETGLSLEDGSTAGSAFWQRQANVFVAGNWGALKMGRQFTPSYLVQATYELTGEANYSVLNNTYGAAGLGARANSAIAYISPNWGGFQMALAHVSRNNRDPVAERLYWGRKNIWDLGLMYTGQNFSGGFSVNKGALSDSAGYQLGGKYSFGNFAVAASWSHTAHAEMVDDPLNNRDKLTLHRRGFGLGASANFGAFSLAVDATRDNKHEHPLGRYTVKGKKYTNVVVEAKYTLSKRTFVYGAALRLDGQSNYGLGLRHSF